METKRTTHEQQEFPVGLYHTRPLVSISGRSASWRPPSLPGYIHPLRHVRVRGAVAPGHADRQTDTPGCHRKALAFRSAATQLFQVNNFIFTISDPGEKFSERALSSLSRSRQRGAIPCHRTSYLGIRKYLFIVKKGSQLLLVCVPGVSARTFPDSVYGSAGNMPLVFWGCSFFFFPGGPDCPFLRFHLGQQIFSSLGLYLSSF